MRINLQLSKWRNRLAMRLPARWVRRLGLREGDQVQGWSRRAFAAELAQAREALPMGTSVIDELRDNARY